MADEDGQLERVPLTLALLWNDYQMHT